MITTSEMQYGGMLTSVLLALTLALQLPRRSARNKVYGRARWLMAGGLLLLALQFLIQYIFDFRSMGVTQAVFVNLLMFIPCSVLISMGVLYLQRQGRVSMREWLVGWLFYLAVAAVLTTAVLADGVPFHEESTTLRAAEYVGAALYAVMQYSFFRKHWREYQHMRRAVDEYYDRERSDLLGWMGRSVVLLAVLTLTVPFVIFAEGWVLSLFGSLFFLTIYYCASCFHSYGISLDTQRVEEARQSLQSDETATTAAMTVPEGSVTAYESPAESPVFMLSPDDHRRVDEAAARWVDAGSYMQRDLTLTTVAAGMGVPRYLLKAWLQASEYHKLSGWLNRLRVDEARRVMTAHPDWGLDAVADHCGFSRSSFHRIFQELEGITPGKFIKRCAVVVMALLFGTTAMQGADSARPWTFWYWMYGAVSEAGIKADLQAMKDVGLGGCYLMPIRGTAEQPALLPPLPGGDAQQLTPRFWQLVDYAMQQADSLGLELGFHICDGFALAGGPWITPQESMQQVVWTDTIITLAAPSKTIALPQPAKGPGGYYEDIAAYAVPIPAALLREGGKAAGRGGSKTLQGIELPTPVVSGTIERNAAGVFRAAQRATDTDTLYIVFDYGRPVTVRSVEVIPSGNNLQSQRLLVQASTDGTTYSDVRQLTPPRQGWQNTDQNYTYALPETTARYFRFGWAARGTEPGAEDLDAAKWSPVLKLADVRLSALPCIDQYESKNGAVWRQAVPFAATVQQAVPFAATMLQHRETGEAGTPPAPLRIEAGTTLEPGTWRILRMGHVSTGHTNATGGGAKGLECDKFSVKAVEKQVDSWFGLFKQRPHSRVVTMMHVDSWECGSQNWSSNFASEFERRRGYDLMPFLPVYAGVAIEGLEKAQALVLSSDEVLSDICQTIDDLKNEVFFQTVARKAREYGVGLSAESVAPTMMSDGMSHYKYVDVPMGEFWLNSPTHDKPNDMLDAISAAHVYGKNIVQAEAFTEVRGVWDETPASIKRMLDRHLALGVNRLFFHVFTHNPYMDRRPGMTLDGIGLFFQRDQTWFAEATGLVDYITRCQRLLQQGQPVVDIAVYTGEEYPRRALTPDKLVHMLPGLFGQERILQEEQRYARASIDTEESPVGVRHSAGIFSLEGWSNALHGYHYDSMNHDALLNQPFPYRVLVVPAGTYVEPYAQERINKLQRRGVVIIEEPYAGNTFGRLQPDVISTGGNDKWLAFAHRRDDSTNTDIYFVSCDSEEKVLEGFLSFRIDGRRSVIYDAMEDRYYPSRAIMANGRMNVPYKLRPGESMFVIFADSVPDTPHITDSQQHLVEGPWDIRFLENGKELSGQRLFDWRKSSDDSIRYYSGRARYTTTFQWKSDFDTPPAIVELELERVADVAHVWLNGVDCGTAWYPPYDVDVTKAIRNGENELVIDVVNTWNNALQGAEQNKPPFAGIWTNAKYRRKKAGPYDNGLLPAGLLGHQFSTSPSVLFIKEYSDQ